MAAVDKHVLVDVAHAFVEEEVGDGDVAGEGAANGEIEGYGAL